MSNIVSPLLMSVINQGPPALQTEQGVGEAHLDAVNEKRKVNHSISGSVTHLTRGKKKNTHKAL